MWYNIQKVGGVYILKDLFEKVVTGFNKGVSSVSEGSKLIVEKARLNTQIQSIEKRRNELIKDLGCVTYKLQMCGDIHIEQCDNLCNDINDLNKKIEEFESEIRILESRNIQSGQTDFSCENIIDGIKCSCGFVNKSTAKFCSKCGSALFVDNEDNEVWWWDELEKFKSDCEKYGLNPKKAKDITLNIVVTGDSGKEQNYKMDFTVAKIGASWYFLDI